MSFMPYVAPEQMMKDRSEYAHKGIARGRSVIGVEYADGLLFIAENPSATLHKISEIYDRIAFAGVGKYSEFEELRIAGIRLADLRGFSYGREDVKARDLANAYSQALSNIFTQQMKPYEVEILVGRGGRRCVRNRDLPHPVRRLGDRRARVRRDRRARRGPDGLAQGPLRRGLGSRARLCGPRSTCSDRPRTARSRRARSRPACSTARPNTGAGSAGSNDRRSPSCSPADRVPAFVHARRRLSGWTGASSGSRTSTASPAPSGGSAACRPTRSPDTCSVASCTGDARRTCSSRTGRACTSTSVPIRSTRRRSATSSRRSWRTTRRGSASSRRCSARPRCGCTRRASPGRSTCSRTTRTRRATATAVTRTTWSDDTASSPAWPTCSSRSS